MSAMNEPKPAASSILRLNPEDNVGVVTGEVAAGERLTFEGQEIRAADRLRMGHKLALVRIAEGETILKWGLPIGSATRPIQPGEAVHVHNMKSDYLPTYTLDGTNPYLKEE